MRTAPPTEPGHADRPLEAGEPRGRGACGPPPAALAAPPACTVVPSISIVGERVAEHDGEPVEPGVGDEQVRALPTTSDGDAGVAPRPSTTALEVGVVVARRPSSAAAAADPVGRERAERHVARRPVAERSPRPRPTARRLTSSDLDQDLVGQRREVAGAEGEAEVAGAQLAAEVGDEVVARCGSQADPLPADGASSTAFDDELAGDARARRLAGRVDVGDREHVGVDERVGEVLPQGRGAAVAVGLEHADDPVPVALPAPRRARPRPRSGRWA